jgi:hypothetical protein
VSAGSSDVSTIAPHFWQRSGWSRLLGLTGTTPPHSRHGNLIAFIVTPAVDATLLRHDCMQNRGAVTFFPKGILNAAIAATGKSEIRISKSERNSNLQIRNSFQAL